MLKKRIAILTFFPFLLPPPPTTAFSFFNTLSWIWIPQHTWKYICWELTYPGHLIFSCVYWCIFSLCLVFRAMKSFLFRFPINKPGSHGIWGLPKLAEFPEVFTWKHYPRLPLLFLSFPWNQWQSAHSHLSFGEKFLLSLNLGYVEIFFFTPHSSSVNHFPYHSLWSCLPLLPSFQNPQNFSPKGNGISSITATNF